MWGLDGALPGQVRNAAREPCRAWFSPTSRIEWLPLVPGEPIQRIGAGRVGSDELPNAVRSAS
jgi:hypothetical protein